MDEKKLVLYPQFISPKRVFLGLNSLRVLSDLTGTILTVGSQTALSQINPISSFLFAKTKVIKTSGEPKIENIYTLSLNLKGKYDYVIGFGGGSAMDTAKIIRKDNGGKLILIPTVIGSGSEASQYAVVTHKNEKQVFYGEEYLPDWVFLIADLLLKFPPKKLFIGSMDSLSHSLEGLVSRKANFFSDQLALFAMDTIHNYLGLLSKKKKLDYIEKLQWASFISGEVQSSVSVGLTHAIAHHIGPRLNIPHAEAIARFLPLVLDENVKGTIIYKKLDNSKYYNSKHLVRDVKDLYKRFDINFKSLDYGQTDLENLAIKIQQDVCFKTNPVFLSTQIIRNILRKGFSGKL